MSTYTIKFNPAVPGDAPSPDEIRRLRASGTTAECRAAGMKLWDETGFMLIPGAWVDALPDDLLVESIGARIVTVAELRAEPVDGWKDTRHGMLGFGWMPRDRRST